MFLGHPDQQKHRHTRKMQIRSWAVPGALCQAEGRQQQLREEQKQEQSRGCRCGHHPKVKIDGREPVATDGVRDATILNKPSLKLRMTSPLLVHPELHPEPTLSSTLRSMTHSNPLKVLVTTLFLLALR